MNLGGIANLPSLTSTGVYSLDSTMDPPGMDVWLAPAPAHQTLVQGVTLDGRDGDGNRASSPILGMDGDRDVDWGGLFGGGTNSYGASMNHPWDETIRVRPHFRGNAREEEEPWLCAASMRGI